MNEASRLLPDSMFPESPPIAGNRDSRAQSPAIHEEDSGLHPVQPGLVPVFDQYDLAPELSEIHDLPRDDKNTAFASDTYESKEPVDPVVSQNPARRTICGLRRRNFWLLFGAAVLVVAVGAAVGGVMGSKSSRSQSEPDASATVASTSSSTTATITPTAVPLRSQVGSGFAMLSPLTDNNNGSVKLIYWQDPDGNIIEGRYPSADFVQSSNVTVIQAADTTPGTPLSAITWTIDGSRAYRALVYIDSEQRLMITNTTTSDMWSEPYNILGGNDTVVKDSLGLAACVGNLNAYKGIRVYYASNASESIGEVGKEIGHTVKDDSEWAIHNYFASTDITAGFACTFVGSLGALYYRNSTSATLEAQHYDYSNSVNRWQIDTVSQEEFNSAVAIAAWDGTEDGQNHFDQIVKQYAPDGNLQVWQYEAGSSEVAFNKTLHQAYVGSKVAGLRNADGQWIVYQSSDGDNSQVMFERVDREDANADGRGVVMGVAQ